MGNWEEKLEKLVEETGAVDVRHVSGVPTWTVLLLQRILEVKKKTDIREVWPNLEVFFHGAVSFAPTTHVNALDVVTTEEGRPLVVHRPIY